jgi:hypothetical protein
LESKLSNTLRHERGENAGQSRDPPQHQQRQLISHKSELCSQALHQTELRPLLSSTLTLKSKEPTPSRVQTLNKIKLLHKYMTGELLTTFEFTRDTAAVSSFVDTRERWRSPESKIQQFEALSSIFKVLESFQL